MADDLDLSAGDVLDGKATIAEVGTRVFDHICRVAGGEVQARAEVHKHREFQVWTQSAISL
jgi:altronate dehydratase